MARIRTIKPEFPQAESMGNVSRDARLLFVLLWTLADDDGRTRASSRLLASLLYPYDNDVPALIDDWLDELEREECIRRYVVGRETYLHMPKWADHQKIDRPSASKLPEPPPHTATIASPREDSRAFNPRAGAQDLDLGPRTMDQEGTRNGKGATEQHAATAAPPKPQPHWAGGSAQYNDAADALVDWMRVNPEVAHVSTRKAIKQVTGAVVHRGFTGADIAEAEDLWYAEHWRGKNATRTDTDRAPTAKEAQDWLGQVGHRIREELPV